MFQYSFVFVLWVDAPCFIIPTTLQLNEQKQNSHIVKIIASTRVSMACIKIFLQPSRDHK